MVMIRKQQPDPRRRTSGLLHQRFGDRAAQVRLAPVLIRKGIEDTELALAHPDGVPDGGGLLPFRQRQRALEEGGHRLLLANLRHHSRQNSDLVHGATLRMCEKSYAFVSLYCGGIPESLFENERFGHRLGG